MNRPHLRRAGPGVWQSPLRDLTLRRIQAAPGPRGGRRHAWTVDGLDGEWPTLTAAAAAHRDRIEGIVYLLHFERPFRHARHYSGWVSSAPGALERRLAEHRAGRGARIIQRALEADPGFAFRLARTWPGDRHLERRLKRWGGAAQHCPACQERDRRRRRAAQRARRARSRALSAPLPAETASRLPAAA